MKSLTAYMQAAHELTIQGIVLEFVLADNGKVGALEPGLTLNWSVCCRLCFTGC